MTETVTAIVVGLVLGAMVGLVGYRWGWQAGVGAAALVAFASLGIVLTDVAAIQAVTFGLLACAAVGTSISHIGGRKQVA